LFDDWRAAYPTMSLQEQIDFHAQVWKRWPDAHQHSDDKPAEFMFGQLIDQPVSVLEIGGWTGDLAKKMLAAHANIEGWYNIEICAEAVGKAMQIEDERYAAMVPNVWPWESDNSGFNVLYMQHVIEHMTFEQFIALIDSGPDIEWVFIQSPLEMDGRDWTGYPGCHILEVGWDTIDAAMEQRGFTLQWAWWDTQYSTAPENGRTRIYRRSQY
jgi:hypothetical protein